MNRIQTVWVGAVALFLGAMFASPTVKARAEEV